MTCLRWAVALALFAIAPVASAQGLGDASKKEKQRRAQGQTTAAKTYTQEELAKLPPVSTAAASPAGAPSPASGVSTLAASGSNARTDAGGDSQREEGEWRARVAAARARVDKARQRYERFAAMNLVPGYEYQDASGRTAIGSIGELQQLTAAAKADLDGAEKALADLLETARRANVPPGWLR